KLLLLEPELPEERLERLGLLDRVQILSVDVLDQRFAEEVGIPRIPKDDRDARQSGRLRGPEASLSGDELVPPIPRTTHDERLQDPDLPDRRCQGRDGLVVEPGPWLLRIRRDRVDRHLHQSRRGLTRL